MHFAQTLSQNFGTVYYWSPWVSAFPSSNELLVGQGLPGVTRVQSIWDVFEDVDLWVFPDCYYGALQSFLVAQGERVWGSRDGDELELDRVKSKQLLAREGIDIGPYEVVQGLGMLREYLQENDDVYVKVSALRGDCETFHAPTYQLIEPQLDRLEWVLGAKKELMTFICEQAIPDAVEVGYDLYSIDGRYPAQATYGIEIKSRAFLMECCPYRALPTVLRRTNEKLSPLLRGYGYRGFISYELRVTLENVGYMIDPTCRMPSPPGELMGQMITNWADIVWEGSAGVMVEPECLARYGASLRLVSDWAVDNWQPVYFPEAIADFVKLRNCCRIGGRWYALPGMAGIGAVSATDDTIAGAIKKVRAYAEQVEGYGITSVASGMDEAAAEFDRLSEIDRAEAAA